MIVRRIAGQLGVPLGDLVLPAGIVAMGTAELVGNGYARLGVGLLMFWAASLALCARRRWPLVMPLAVGGFFMLAAALGFDVSEPASWLLAIALSCFAAGRYPARNQIWLGLLSTVAEIAIIYGTLSGLTDFSPDAIFGIVFTIAPWAVAVALNRALEQNRRLAAEAERARFDALLEAQQAALAERERIGRDLHDILAHSLSVMVVQASVAEDAVGRDDAAAADALRRVQDTGREALAETGRLLELIRDDEGEPVLPPAPRVADLPALIEHFTRAGLHIEQQIAGCAALPAGVETSAYRIVQEGLTNVLKHAPGSTVRLRLERDGDRLAIEIENGPPASAPVANVSGGHGLAGIRERVSLFGGWLESGSDGNGGYRLAAVLPAQMQAQ